MKKIALALMAALLATGVGFAQTVMPATPAAQAQTLQSVKATGKLELVQGAIGLKANGKTYILPGLARLAGFIPGVVEGGSVTVEGYERALPYTSDVVLLQVTKLTVGGKDYDLGQAWAGRGMGMGRGMMQGGRGGMMMRGGRW